jgi:hypothetical protein
MNPTLPDPAAPAADGAACAQCAAGARTLPPEQFVYAIGRLDLRFPSLGIEREYQQRERQLHEAHESPSLPRGARLRAVLERNPHLALRVSFVFVIDGMPVYALQPGGGFLKDALFAALSGADDKDHFCVLIGRAGSFASPPGHGGLLLTTVTADQLYNFSLAEWSHGLAKTAQPVLAARKLEPAHFDELSRTLFRDLSSTPENLGSADGHRALNYLLVQHPGIFLAAAERRHHTLDRLETRLHQTAGGRRHVVVILVFVDRASGVPERLYCTVDVTEEWPFLVGSEAAGSALGLAPFVDSAVYTAA